MTESARVQAPDVRCLIEDVFAECFASAEDVCVEGGFDEPVYQPGAPAVIGYRADFVNSLLHEIAHWCVAGRARRQLTDYGYWYQTDTRDLSAQRKFESVERRPQALECLFAHACGLPFRVSADNIALADYDSFGFRLAVWQCVHELQRDGIGARAEHFLQALAATFGQDGDWRRWPVLLADVGG